MSITFWENGVLEKDLRKELTNSGGLFIMRIRNENHDDNSKPVEKQGRKAKGLRLRTMTAGCRMKGDCFITSPIRVEVQPSVLG